MIPATTVTTDSFLDSVFNSQLTGEENVRLAIAGLTTESASELANVLVRKNILNQWQAQYLLAGHSGLRIGNYILKGRVGQDSLGERFFADQVTLVRTVDLQLLPESLVAAQECMDRFLESARQLTHLDHPAIVHLYDVADHHGLLFIVSEHCESMTANEFRGIAESGLAHLRAVRDLCDGVSYLHEHDLSHGFLGAENSIRLARPGVIKLDQLVWSVLQRELVSRSLIETFEQRRLADWQEVGRFASKLLAAAPTDNALSQTNRDSLVSAFRALATSTDPDARARIVAGKISELVNRIEKRPGYVAVPVAVSPADSNAGKLPRLAATASATPSPPAAASPAPSRARPVKNSPKPKTRPKKTAGRPGTLRWVPVASLVVLACVVGWFAWGKLAPKQKPETAQRETRTSNTSRGGRTETPKPKTQKPESQAATSQTTSETKKTPDDIPSPVDLTPTGSTEPVAPTPLIGDSLVPEASLPVVLTPDPAKPVSTSLPEKSKPKPGPEQSDGQDNLVPASAGSGSKQDPVTAEPGTAEVAPETWPASFALLDGSHHDPQEIGKLPAIPAGEVTVSLEYDPETNGRGKNWFSVQGSGRSWNIAFSKKSINEELETVAALKLDDQGRLIFQWNDSVDEKHLANSIVNAAIRLQSGGLVHRTWMRETIRFDAPTLDPTTLESAIKLEVPWMPKSEHVVIEFGELWADQGWTEEAMLENETFLNREPARIFFRSLPEERFLWLALDGRVRAKVELTLNVQTIVAGRMTNMKRQELDGFINVFRANHEALVIRENQALIAADNAPFGSKTKARDAARQAKKDTETGKAQRDLAFEYLAWIEGLVGKPVPVRVMYHVGEQSIELARSSGWELPPPPDKETKKD